MANIEVAPTYAIAKEQTFSHVPERQGSEMNDQEMKLQSASTTVDFVLGQIDDLLDIIRTPDVKDEAFLTHTSDMCVQASFPVPGKYTGIKKTCMITAFTQTSEDLESNAIASLQEKVIKSRWEVDIMKEHFRNVEQGFRMELARRAMALNKADETIDTANKDLALLRDRVGRISLSVKRGADSTFNQDGSNTPIYSQYHQECPTAEPDVEMGVFPPRTPSGDHSTARPTLTSDNSGFPVQSPNIQGRPPRPPIHMQMQFQGNNRFPQPASSPAVSNTLAPSVTFHCGPDSLQKRQIGSKSAKPKPGDREDIPVVKIYDHEYAMHNKRRRVRFGMEEILYI